MAVRSREFVLWFLFRSKKHYTVSLYRIVELRDLGPFAPKWWGETSLISKSASGARKQIRSATRFSHTHSAHSKDLCCPAIAIPSSKFLLAGRPSIIARKLSMQGSCAGIVVCPHSETISVTWKHYPMSSGWLIRSFVWSIWMNMLSVRDVRDLSRNERSAYRFREAILSSKYLWVSKGLQGIKIFEGSSSQINIAV